MLGNIKFISSVDHGYPMSERSERLYCIYIYIQTRDYECNRGKKQENSQLFSSYILQCFKCCCAAGAAAVSRRPARHDGVNIYLVVFIVIVVTVNSGVLSIDNWKSEYSCMCLQTLKSIDFKRNAEHDISPFN